MLWVSLFCTYYKFSFFKVAYLVRGNEYNGKYYVNLRAIAIGHLDEDGKTKMAKAPVAKSKPIVTQVDEDDDDLPF